MENAICDGDKARKPFRRGYKPHGAKSGCCGTRNNSRIGGSCNIGHSLVGPHCVLSKKRRATAHDLGLSALFSRSAASVSLVLLSSYCCLLQDGERRCCEMRDAERSTSAALLSDGNGTETAAARFRCNFGLRLSSSAKKAAPQSVGAANHMNRSLVCCRFAARTSPPSMQTRRGRYAHTKGAG